MTRTGSNQRPLAIWRVVGGACLHFVLPAYLVATPLVAMLSAPANSPIAAIVGRIPMASGWVLVAYATLTLVSVVLALALEPVARARTARRATRHPGAAATASRRRVARAIADGMTLGPEPARFLDGFRGDRWDHDDAQFQSLSTDLAHVVRASTAALSSAPPARRAAIADLTDASLRRIEVALRALQLERSRLDEGDVRTLAHYVEMRYGTSEFAGEQAQEGVNNMGTQSLRSVNGPKDT